MVVGFVDFFIFKFPPYLILFWKKSLKPVENRKTKIF